NRPTQTTEPDKRRQGMLAGALLIEYAYTGSVPNVRLITSQTVRSGRPSLHSVTRWRANAYAIGPLVPSETVRRYKCDAGRLAARAAPVPGVVPEATTRFERTAPYRYSSCPPCTGVGASSASPTGSPRTS